MASSTIERQAAVLGMSHLLETATFHNVAMRTAAPRAHEGTPQALAWQHRLSPQATVWPSQNVGFRRAEVRRFTVAPRGLSQCGHTSDWMVYSPV